MRCQRGFCTKFPDILKLVIVPSGASFLKFKDINYRCRGKTQKGKQKHKWSYIQRELNTYRNSLERYLTFPQLRISVNHTVNDPLGIRDRDVGFWNKQANKEPEFGLLSILCKLCNLKQPPAPESFSCLIWVLEIIMVALLASRNPLEDRDAESISPITILL